MDEERNPVGYDIQHRSFQLKKLEIGPTLHYRSARKTPRSSAFLKHVSKSEMQPADGLADFSV
jgi:hypothetical protein